MQARNRRKEVMATLKHQKTVYVKDLADSLEVSDMTIRRDLHRLADLGMVTLIHGGAVLNEGTATLDSVRARATRMSKEKSAIAARCAGLVKEGNAVYLDTGTTVMEIAEAVNVPPPIEAGTSCFNENSTTYSEELRRLTLSPQA